MGCEAQDKSGVYGRDADRLVCKRGRYYRRRCPYHIGACSREECPLTVGDLNALDHDLDYLTLLAKLADP